MTVSLLLAGCGKMGGALLEGWLERGVAPGNVTIVEANRDLGATLAERHGVTVHETPDRIAASLKPDVVVLAVKPQMMDDVAPAYGRFTGPDTVFLSIAAGRPIAYFQDRLGAMAAIVRSMPNTPAAVRRGITVACPNERVSDGQKRTCHDLLEAVGEVAWVGDESLLDAGDRVRGRRTPAPGPGRTGNPAPKRHQSRRYHGRSPEDSHGRRGSPAPGHGSHRRGRPPLTRTGRLKPPAFFRLAFPSLVLA